MILQIHRDVVKRGCEAAFRAVEEEAARLCAEHGCPHPHLGMELLTGERAEVWWLNTFESDAHRQHVTDLYVSNGPLMAALEKVRKGREGLLDVDTDTCAHYRSDRSYEAGWSIAGARFFAVTITTSGEAPRGAVFETADGTCFAFRPATTHEHLNVAGGATEFAVRPYWGMPAREWIAADPEFWKVNPAARIEA